MVCVGCSMESSKVPCPYCMFAHIPVPDMTERDKAAAVRHAEVRELTDKQKMELWQAVVVPNPHWRGTPAWAIALGLCS